MTRRQRLGLLAALGLGLVFIAVMVNLRQGPARDLATVVPQAVRTLEVTALPFQLEAKGFGKVSPGDSWQAVASVGGQITWTHPELSSGNLIPAGTRLLEIDPSRFELALAAAEADSAAARAELQQLIQELGNTEKLLALEQRRLALAERELERAQTLAARNALSATRLDEQERATLQQRQAVQALNNQLALVPARRSLLEARLARAEAARDQARRDIADTRFDAPFDLRIHDTRVERYQQVNPGQPLFTADSIATAEAVIQIPLAQMRQLLTALSPIRQEDTDGFPDLHRRFDLDRIGASLSLAGDPATRWPARVIRIANGVDPATRTLQVVLEVTEPYRNANPPLQPPLVRDMYVHGILDVAAAEPVVVVPAASIHQGMAYVVDDGNRLTRHPVTTGWTQRDLTLVTAGLEVGDRLILDDLVPAIDGTPLTPAEDADALARLQQLARGARP